jgi:hypothetical protein
MKKGSRRGLTKSKVTQQMRANSELYVESLLNPFEFRGARIPDPSPFPSTVGTSVQRFQPATVTDSVDSKVYAAMMFSTDRTNGGTWTATVTAMAATSATWTTAEHPHQSSFASNFFLMRTVSMGVRVMNVGELVSRGGAMYVSYTAQPPAALTLIDLKLADETEVYDAARLKTEGLVGVYIPMSKSPILIDSASLTATGSTYESPTVTLTAKTTHVDTNIVIWFEGTGDEDLVPIFEQVDNWEAIPFPQTEYLFDRKAVVGTPTTTSEAMSLATEHPAVTSTVKSGFKGPTPTSMASAASTTLAKTGKGLLTKVMNQVGSLALKGLSALPGMLLSFLDYQNHVMAVRCGFPQLSPLVERKLRGLRKESFDLMMANALEDRVRASIPKPKPEPTFQEPECSFVKVQRQDRKYRSP